MPHVIVDVTSHGFGHLAQTSPILRALLNARPDIKLTVRTNAPSAALRDILNIPFNRARPAPDLGMAMHTPYQVDTVQTLHAYRNLHQKLNKVICAEAQALASLGGDLLISNVGYVSLAAAQLLKMPNIAMCSLNWADIFAAYCDAPDITEQMRAIYSKADHFIRFTPALDMPWCPNTVCVGPVGRTSHFMRDQLARALGCPPDKYIVLFSLGGIPTAFTPQLLPKHDSIHWIIDQHSTEVPDRNDISSIPELSISFLDAISASDAILAKLGYGMFVEAALHKTKVAYCERDDWPETAVMEPWINRHVPTCRLTLNDFETGHFLPALLNLLQTPHTVQSDFSDGVAQTLSILTKTLGKDTLIK